MRRGRKITIVLLQVHGKDPWFEMRWAPEDEEEDEGEAAADPEQQQQNGAA